MFATLRRVASIGITASLLAGSLVLVQPTQPVAAATCYWSSWMVRTQTATNANIKITSTVRYRVGYSCGGFAEEIQVDYRTARIEVRGDLCQCWLNQTGRVWRSHHIYRAEGWPIDYYDPPAACYAARCDMYSNEWNNYSFEISNNDRPFAYIYCTNCSPDGFSHVIARHYFRTNEMSANYQEW
jgi:hypothetical protein